MSREWLLQRAPGFAALPENEQTVIIDFTFLWSLFEAQVMGNHAQSVRMRTKVDEWQAAGTLEPERYDAELAYFQQRYFAQGEFTHHFYHLHLRKCDQRDLVQAVLSGNINDGHNRLVALLMIVWRFRNNLFHGEKWAYQLQDQLQNFTHANAALMRLLERHGNLAP